jgi:gliding motility-associated-like protein
VDVSQTSETQGNIEIKWLRPFTDPNNLDLNVFKGPYKINLMHRVAAADNFEMIYTFATPVFTDLPQAFTHSLINTKSQQHNYYISFYSDSTFIGNSQRANSEFLSSVSSDRRIDLQWKAEVPWDNFNYKIFKRDSGASTYVLIGTTTTTAFSDQNAVVNGKPYQYYVEAAGLYSDTLLPRPLINRSEEIFAKAKDRTAPVSPTLQIVADCASGDVNLSWNDISIFSDDVASYQLLYKPSVDAAWVPVTIIKQGDVLTFNSDGLTSIAGCYAVNATDINGNIGNNSPDFCIDNCPQFELPNVFTPNGDGVNDFFTPIKVRQIKEISLTVCDRWGNLAFKSTDPNFKWDGISQVSKTASSEGTFFYVCEVFEWRVNGIAKRTLKGTVQLIR